MAMTKPLSEQVRFTQAGAGAVERLASEKLKDVVSVKDFGAVGDGVADDTAAIQAALAFIVSSTSSGITASNGLSTSYSGTSPRLHFPKGRYKIVSELLLGSYLEVYGDSAIIEQATNTASIFVCDVYQLKIQGLQFVGGKHQIDFYNANINSTMVEVSHCQFFLSRDYAINTRATGGVYSHLSCELSIYKCRFLACNKVLNNCCDSATLETCWIQPSKTNMTASTAVILNRGTSVGDPDAFTRLHIKDCFLIPDVGTEGVDRVEYVRWVDNYGSVTATHSRFGGEYGGMSIVWHHGAPNTAAPWNVTEVIFRDCTLFAGPDSRVDSCVVGIQAQIPNRISIRNCSGPVGKPLVANLSSLNIPAFMAAFESASGKKAYEYFKLDIEDIIYDINAYSPTRTVIPWDLYKYAVKGKQTRVRRAAPQSIANGYVITFVSFDTVDFDNVGAFDPANPTRIVMPKGCYKMRINIAVMLSVDGAAKTVAVTLVTSGLERLAGDTSLRGINPDAERISFSADVEGPPDSYWHVNIQHNAAAALSLLECRVSATPIDFAG